ncbi:hypothetical protein P170DRAFT_495047 [Aspergillus steynii IBT 23096]|uniref:Secreted protein n=1 Tax=Aspergillus steynii IBT 23096 TaxID=1392250 RepID=A0A2I2G8R5_9EURO|nr:uncharacterized protein P170DRAFT_495047 [Aspergillus steynii IBT 23096]PLB49272.1 hypothetical protein P170DRAFT_495047 [Aspergillus steynii IBT 23096]
MKFHFTSLLALSMATVSLADDLQCSSKKSCISHYYTGSSCKDGYTSYDSKDKAGSYNGYDCFRDCNPSEKSKCIADQCAAKKKHCQEFPGGAGCIDAVEFCADGVKMDSKECNARKMEQFVEYKDGKCRASERGGAAPDVRGHSIFVRTDPKGRGGPRMTMECLPIKVDIPRFNGRSERAERKRAGKPKGTSMMRYNAALGKAFKSVGAQCESTTKSFRTRVLTTACVLPEDKWDQLEEKVEEACKSAQSGDDQPPDFHRYNYTR